MKTKLLNGWREIHLSEVLETLENGGRPTGGIQEIDDGIPSLGGEHLDSSGGFNFDNVRLIPKKFYEELKRGKIKKYDVLLVKDGATTGKVSIVDDNFPYEEAAVNEHLFILRGKKDLIDQGFLFYHLLSPLGQRLIKTSFHGAAIGGINTQFVKNYLILLPPLQVQKKVVSILQKAVRIRKLRKEADELTKDFLKAVFLKMFGDPTTNLCKWKVTDLASICQRITDGTHQPPEFVPAGIPFLFVSNIVKGKIDFSTKNFISQKTYVELTRTKPIEINDILYSTVGSYGVAVLVDTDRKFAFQRHIGQIKPNEELVNPIFLQTLLNTTFIMNQAHKHARGVAQKTLNLSEIRKFRIILPPKDLQNKFASIVKEIEKMKEHQQQSKEQIHNLFNNLMQKSFQGELAC